MKEEPSSQRIRYRQHVHSGVGLDSILVGVTRSYTPFIPCGDNVSLEIQRFLTEICFLETASVALLPEVV